MRSLGAPLWGESGGVLIPLMATPSWHSVHVGTPSLPSHMSTWGRRVRRGPWLFQDAARGRGGEGRGGWNRVQAGRVCGQEAVKHSEVREVPETGARLGG